MFSNESQPNLHPIMWFTNFSGDKAVIHSYPIVPLYIFRISLVIAGLALILNILHIAAMSSMPKVTHLADKNFKMYVIYLSAVNIGMMILQLVTDHPEAQAFMYENHWSCVLSNFINHNFIICAGWQLFLVSIERLIATVSPLNYKDYFYVRHFIVPLVVVHLWVMAMYGGLGIAIGNMAFSVKGSGCCQISGRDYPKLSLLPVIQGFVITTVITVIYVILIAKSIQLVRATSASSKTSRNQARMKRQMVLTIGALLLSKWMGWLPILTAVALRATPFHKPIIDYVARLFLTGFSLMTPFAYGVTSTKYRKFLIKCWIGLWKRHRGHVMSKESGKKDLKSPSERNIEHDIKIDAEGMAAGNTLPAVGTAYSTASDGFGYFTAQSVNGKDTITDTKISEENQHR